MTIPIDPKTSFSKRLSIILLLIVGFGLLTLTGFDVIIYGLQAEWEKVIVVFFSWGFVGIGLTLIGLALLIQSKLQQA